jgi:hypothetical protein
LKARVARAVHLAHAAGTERRLDDVTVDGVSGLERHDALSKSVRLTSAPSEHSLISMRRHAVATLFALALHASLPRAALAESPARHADLPDTVVLSDGRTLRGTVRELVRGSHVRLELEDHGTATIPWSGVVRIEHASNEPLPEGTATERTTIVHIDSPSEVQLESRTRDDREWRLACDSPCDRALPIGPEYRIRGSGVRASNAFHLRAGAPRIVLTVDPASTSGFVLGIVGTSIGGATVIIGALVLLIGAVVSSNKNADTGGITAVGTVITLGGGAMLTGGILAISSNARTGVELRTNANSPAATFGAPKQAFTVPLFQLSF